MAGAGSCAAGPRTRPGSGPALLALLVVTGGLYLWDLGAPGWANTFYSAAVQAGTKSWKAFFFGSFDSSNFITVDKPPASLWVMELSARIFGRQLLEHPRAPGPGGRGRGRAPLRDGPPVVLARRPACIAGAVLALTPVAALMFRYNNPDALLVLLLVAAAYATVRAVEDGQDPLAGARRRAASGFGFITKMLQAFVVVPALGARLPAGRAAQARAPDPPAARRPALALVVSAGWWVAAVQLTPAADRPYIGGSQNNSLFNLIFGYNGFGRLTGNETGSVGGGRGGRRRGARPGWTRMFNVDVRHPDLLAHPGRAGRPRRRPRGSTLPGAAARPHPGGVPPLGRLAPRDRAVFSFAQGIIHPYYTVALAPAIGALVGMGAVELWRRRASWFARGALAVAIGLTAWWADVLLDRTPSWFPWLRGVVLVRRHRGGRRRSSSSRCSAAARRRLRRRRWRIGAALAGPLAFTIDTVATPASGAIPTAGPSAPGRCRGLRRWPRRRLRPRRIPGRLRRVRPRGTGPFTPPGGLGGRPAVRPGLRGRVGGCPGAVRLRGRPGSPGRGRAGRRGARRPAQRLAPRAARWSKLLQADAGHYRWVAAAVGANTAAGYQLGSGDPVMAIGGFNGTDPDPTPRHLRAVGGRAARSTTSSPAAASAAAWPPWVAGSAPASARRAADRRSRPTRPPSPAGSSRTSPRRPSVA